MTDMRSSLIRGLLGSDVVPSDGFKAVALGSQNLLLREGLRETIFLEARPLDSLKIQLHIAPADWDM